MTTLLEEFVTEAREFLQGIGESLMKLEDAPEDAELLGALFRMVHTLKGNSGLFEFPEMTRVLHASEDLMDAVRHGRVKFSRELADQLLEAADFVSVLLDGVEKGESNTSVHAAASVRLATSLRALLTAEHQGGPQVEPTAAPIAGPAGSPEALRALPEPARAEALRSLSAGAPLHLLHYAPSERCFFHGEDPLLQARGTPGFLWGSIVARTPWPALAELDPYRCNLDLTILSTASRAQLEEHFVGAIENVRIEPIAADALAVAVAVAVASPRSTSALAPDEREALLQLRAVQRRILALPITEGWHRGRLRAVSAALVGLLVAEGDLASIPALDAATTAALEQSNAAPLLAWLDGAFASAPEPAPAPTPPPSVRADAPPPSEARPARRTEEANGASKSVKVDQVKIDRLMNLIGEMVVAKNALPYLAARAETVFGMRELSREIKAQYAVMNRIADELQDAIMHVRMMPVSLVFQRFPRLVRDTSRKLGKDVELVLEGEETAADKNIIEALGDPLVHIIRNSLDHGFELPETRRAAGKPATGTLTIRARQESDRVVIEIQDDGKGIDPLVVKQKAYEKGIIDETTLGRISDREAVNLVFASGFSTMDTVSELSGRGVGMDVVRTAIEKVNGVLTLDSEKGKGTLIRLSLPLSMAVTNVMIVEADGQPFGVPMDSVMETVRVPRADLRTIKTSLATVLRGRIVPLKSLNALLGLAAPPRPNADDELAVLVVRRGGELLGLLVDDFSETLDIILKPMTGVLAGLSTYAGSALMGDGSVLMVLDVKELV